MLTTTHMLVAATATARPGLRPWQVGFAWFGGFLPDMSVFIMVIAARLTGMGGGNLWRQPTGLYWQEPWQTFSAVSNSIPLWTAGFLGAWLVFHHAERFRAAAVGVMVLCGGALLHVLLDLPVHTDDAHIHFWPFTDWRFHSTVSYYQRAFHGEMVGNIETVAGLAMVLFLILRFRSWWIGGFAVLLAVPYFMRIGFLF